MAHRVLKIESLMMFHCTKNVKAHVVAHVKAFFVANISFKKSNEGLCKCVSACVQVNRGTNYFTKYCGILCLPTQIL